MPLSWDRELGEVLGAGMHPTGPTLAAVVVGDLTRHQQAGWGGEK